MTIDINRKVLVLNSDYRPLNYYPLSTMPMWRAIKLYTKGEATIVATHDEELHSPSTTMKAPSVIALRSYVPLEHHIAFNKENVCLRDGYTCQYCGNQFKQKDLTYDHVYPRSKGGSTSWENIVMACHECNNKKDDKHEMVPLNPPRKPTYRELVAAQLEYGAQFIDDSWEDFL